jgi:hypothetical protein
LAEIFSNGAANWPPALLTSAVDPAEVLQDRGYRGLDCFFLADVAGIGARFAACLRDFGPYFVQFLHFSSDQRDPASQRRQLVSGAAADARAASGDDCSLAGEQAGTQYRCICAAVHAELCTRTVCLPSAN